MNLESTIAAVVINLVIFAVIQAVFFRFLKRYTEKIAASVAASVSASTAADAYRLAEARASELHILYDLAETLNQTLPPERALEVGLEKVALQVGATSGWLLTLTPDQKAELSAGFRLPPNMELASGNNRTWALCACLKEMMAGDLNSPRPFKCERLARTPGFDKDHQQHLSIPVQASGVPVGILNLVFPSARLLDETETRLLATLGNQFGGAIERARLFRDVHKLAVTDSLTGIFNRRHFAEVAARELERASRYGHPVSLAILDIDLFKNINDNYGHLAGDQVLIEIARVCQERTRRIDLVGRYGGEEILILMPETKLDQAQQAMERLRREIEALTIETMRGDIQITVSIGVAWRCAESGLDWDAFLDRADQALYRAKKNGRNQVCVI